MNSKRALILGALVAFATGTTGAASADSGKREHGDASIDPSKVTVTMSQAIATAEQQAGGKATRAKLENETGRLLYEVKVASKDKATEVKVDAQDGKVLATSADTNTHRHHRSPAAEKQ